MKQRMLGFTPGNVEAVFTLFKERENQGKMTISRKTICNEWLQSELQPVSEPSMDQMFCSERGS